MKPLIFGLFLSLAGTVCAGAGDKAGYPMNTLGPPTYKFTNEGHNTSSVKIRIHKVRKAIIGPVR